MNISFAEASFDLCHETGKRIFVTQFKAHVCAGRLAVKNKRHGDSHPVHVYRCPDCGHFHVGHTTELRRRA